MEAKLTLSKIKMNYDNYFNLFYRFNKNNLIEENTKVFPFLKNKIILNKNIIKKEKNIHLFICEIKLENGKNLLLKDLPINFLISQTILVGEHSKLYEFDLENKIYICEEKLLENFEETKNLKEFNSKELHNLKFETNFEYPKIIKELKSYLSEYKKINFNKIHITQNSIIENFVPNGKSTHLNLAKEMNIPTTNLIENNYIKNTNINIYDNEKFKEILKPKFILEETHLCKVCKKNKLILYNDINTDYYIKIPTEKITKVIENIKKTNFDKDIVIKEILNKKIIKISANHGKYYLPIWKSIIDQQYLKIENVNDFEELSGMKFQESTENFNRLYLQNKGGNQAIFKNKYLKNNLNEIIENLKEEENIEFENIDELIIKLIFNQKKDIKTISKIENYNPNLIKKSINNFNFILNYIVKKSIEKNEFPKKVNEISDIGNYLLNINKLITIEFENYILTGDKKTLTNNLFKISNNFKKLIKKIQHSTKSFYSMLKIINNVIEIFEKINPEKNKELKENYLEYFKEYKFAYEKSPEINFEIINLINDILKTLSYKENISILIKNKKLDKSYFKNMKILNDEPKFEIYTKPNFELLKKIFKYNYNEIIEQIKKIDEDKNEIIINNKTILLKEEYFSKFHKYLNFKTVLENKYFSVLMQK